MRPTINLDLHQEMKSMGNGVKQGNIKLIFLILVPSRDNYLKQKQ